MYDPLTDTWFEKAKLPIPLVGEVSLSIGYDGTGTHPGFGATKAFFKYTPD